MKSMIRIKSGNTGRSFTSMLKPWIFDITKNKYIYLMALPVIVYYIIFYYIPIYGLQISFKRFSVGLGIWNSPWIGFEHFISFFNSFYFWRLLRNTLLLSFFDLVFSFPAPIILALLLNEIKSKWFKKIAQTVTYMPYFISLAVIVGMMVDFFSRDGLVNNIFQSAGIKSIAFMQEASWFRTLYIGSNIWQSIGWSSIIYLAAITNIDPTLYEASRVDGAGRFRQIFNITIPGITPTIIIILILRLGNMMGAGNLMNAGPMEKVLIMYNPATYETADVIMTYVYRSGILNMDYSFSTAVGLFNGLVNLILLILANSLSKKIIGSGLW